MMSLCVLRIVEIETRGEFRTSDTLLHLRPLCEILYKPSLGRISAVRTPADLQHLRHPDDASAKLRSRHHLSATHLRPPAHRSRVALTLLKSAQFSFAFVPPLEAPDPSTSNPAPVLLLHLIQLQRNHRLHQTQPKSTLRHSQHASPGLYIFQTQSQDLYLIQTQTTHSPLSSACP